MQFGSNQDFPKMKAHARSAGGSSNRRWARVLLCGLAGVALTVFAQPGQAPGASDRPFYAPPSAHPLPDANDQMEMRNQQAKQKSFEAANTERKKQIADDSALLLKLATDLKTEVDKTDKDTLSLTVIRKADEIEKLAHIVKEKMKLTVGQG